MYFCLAREEKGLFDGHALSRITSLAVISFETSSTQTTISFVYKTSLTGCFVLARFLRTCVLWKKGTMRLDGDWMRLYGRHLFPSAKLTFSSQWLSQDISLFLHKISLSLEISVHKSLSLFNFYGKKIQDRTNRIRSRSIGFAVHHFNPYTTQDLRTTNGLI